MNDFRLKSLLETIRRGSFSSAAEFLGITQPAVSQHIKALEGSYGVQLIAKRKNRPVPTREGMLLYHHAEKIEAAYRSIERDMRNASSAVRTYDIGATLTVGEYLLPSLLAEHRRLHAETRIRLAIQNTRHIVERLLRSEIVLGLVEGPVEVAGVEVRSFGRDELVVVAAPDHPLVTKARRRGITLAELLASELILREPGSGTREVFERYLVGRGIDARLLRPYMEIESINTIKLLVRSALGISVVSSLAVKEEIRTGTLVRVPLAGPPIERELRFVWGESADALFVRDFMEFCIASVQRSEAEGAKGGGTSPTALAPPSDPVG